QSRDRKQRVEPTSRLVDRLRDEVRGKGLLEEVAVVAGMAALCEWHRAGVEPRVEHLRDAPHDPTALLARQRDRVDVRAVQVGVVLQADFRRGAYAALVVAGFADPDRGGRAPV